MGGCLSTDPREYSPHGPGRVNNRFRPRIGTQGRWPERLRAPGRTTVYCAPPPPPPGHPMLPGAE